MFDEKAEEFIMASKIFIDFTTEEFRELCGFITESGYKKYLKNEIIFMEGDPILHIGLILSGEVSVSRMLSDGEELYIHKLMRRNTIGIDTAFKVGHTSEYFYRAVTDTEFFRIPLSFVKERGNIPETMRMKLVTNIAIILTQENLRVNARLNIVSEKSLRKRIYIYLSDKQKVCGKETFTIPYNRGEMASFLCVNRSALSKELSRMKQDGILDFHQNTFHLLK